MIGAISFITSLASVSFMPVPDALCIIFACPVITILLSTAILGDELNSLKCFAGTLLLIGVVLVCQPPFLFPQTQDNQVTSSFLLSSHSGLYYVGVALAGTSCCTGGLMNVLIVKCQVGVNIIESKILWFCHCREFQPQSWSTGQPSLDFSSPLASPSYSLVLVFSPQTLSRSVSLIG